jgi:hypothetical protein
LNLCKEEFLIQIPYAINLLLDFPEQYVTSIMVMREPVIIEFLNISPGMMSMDTANIDFGFNQTARGNVIDFHIPLVSDWYIGTDYSIYFRRLKSEGYLELYL